MKKCTHYLLISTLLFGLLAASCIFFIRERRDVIITKGGTSITLWNNYIIFEKFKGFSPPRRNYIKTSKVQADYGYITVIRKKDSSIVMITDRSTVEVNLPNIDQVVILKGDVATQTEKIYSDKSIDLILDCYAHRGNFVPKITEYVHDSIITTEFEPNLKLFTLTSLGKMHTSSTVNIQDTSPYLYDN